MSSVKAKFLLFSLHIYQLTQSDLEKMNWTVIYPPVGDLKDKIVSPDHRK